MPKDKTIKCVVVGDGAVGKTCLLVSYSTNTFPSDYVPTVFDHYAVTVHVASEPYTLCLFDTAGQEEYDQLRRLTYPGTDVFIICFSVTSPDSFNNLRELWVREIQHFSPNTPFLIAGTQCDLRDDPAVVARLRKQGQEMVDTDQARKMAKHLNAVGYIECSALTQVHVHIPQPEEILPPQKNVHAVFNEAILTAVQPPKQKKRRKARLNCLAKSE